MLSAVARVYVYLAFLLLPLTFLRLFSNLTVSDLLIFLAFITLALSSRGKQFLYDALTKNIFLIPLLLFTIGFLVSINNSEFPFDSLTAYLQIAFIFLIAYPTMNEIINDDKQVITIGILLIIPGVIVSILMLLIKMIGVEIGIDLGNMTNWIG